MIETCPLCGHDYDDARAFSFLKHEAFCRSAQELDEYRCELIEREMRESERQQTCRVKQWVNEAVATLAGKRRWTWFT